MESLQARNSASEPAPELTSPPPGGGGSQRRWFPILLWLVLGALVGAAVAHYALERPALDAAQARTQAQEVELAALRGKLEQANLKAIVLEGQLLIEESTRRGLETMLRTTQDELGRARESVAFYEQLLPPGPKGAVTIRALDVGRNGPHLSYRLLLMRSGANAKAFQGSLQFVAKGELNGEAVELPLKAAVIPSDQPESDSEAELLPVEFDDFQRGSGFLLIPEGFTPAVVTVNVLEGRKIRASRSLELALDE